MHFMADGANAGVRRRLEAAARLTTAARRRTAELGLGGFTVDELCDEAGISRRTFFNYFASKEDAVLGFTTLWDQHAAEERFTAGGGTGPGLSETLPGDYADLLVARWTEIGITPERAADLVAAMEREPRLLSRLFASIRDQERADAELVRTREGLAAGDLRAEVLVQVIGAVGAACMREFLCPDNAEPLRTIMQRRLAAAREVFAAESGGTT